VSERTNATKTLRLSSCIAKAVKATARQINCVAGGWLCAPPASEQNLFDKQAHPHQHKYGMQNICGISLSLSLSFLLSFSIFFSLMSLWHARAHSPNLTSSFSLSRSPCFPLSFQSTLHQALCDSHTRPDCLGHQSSTHLKQSTTLYEYLYTSNNLPVN
jgi:hypothetical protein